MSLLSALTVTQPPLENCHQLGEEHYDYKIYKGHGKQRHKGGIGARPDDISALGEILKSDVAGYRSLFYQNDELVCERRKHSLESLRNDYVKHCLKVIESQRSSGFELSGVYAHYSGSDYFSNVRAGVYAECQYRNKNLIV